MASEQSGNLKERLLALTPTELAALKNAYYYHWVTAIMRADGWLNIVLGGLTLWFGLTARGEMIYKIIETVFGIIIISQSLWAIFKPDVPSIRRFSALFLAAGIWNLFVAILNSLQGFALFTGLLGMAQLWWAYQYIKLYQQYLALAPTKPPTETAQLLDEIWNSLAKGKSFAGDEDYIELQIERRWWRGFLLPEQAVLAFKKRKIVVVADKADVVFVPSLSKPTAKWVNVVLKADIVSTAGKIQQHFFQKYQQWKGENIPITAIPPELTQRRRMRLVIRIIAIIVLGLAALCVLFIIATLIQYRDLI